MMEAKPTSGVNSQAGSELNTSVGGMSHQTQPLERRVAWLEEDVAVIHRRVKLECGEIGNGNAAAADSGLRQLVLRLDGELAAERRARQLLEARMTSLEASMKKDKIDREAHLKGFSTELEGVMRGLIGRIDEGLSAGAASMKERTDQTEVRMRRLINRVDEGLTAGAAALKDSLTNPGEKLEKISETPGSREQRPSRPEQRPAAGSRGSTSPVTVQQQHMLQVRASGGGTNPGAMLSASRQRSPQGSQAPSHFRSPVATPSMAYPCSLQVPGSGLNGAPQGMAGRQVPQQIPQQMHPHMQPGQPMMQGRVPAGWVPNVATR
mmetsp:Transcript_37806/g.46847  ORF Transcript_37806/g.46847 Transcript_37806/m.46847 type:complete len:322 (-) Transcript_37806:131-1096(-)